jgi:hypothetical protein
MQPQGIDELPVEFQMAGGGIVAFQEGKKVPRIQDEETISDEERERLQLELLTRIIGEEARNPPPPKRPPMEITESDLTSIPGMESGDLMARALAEARGPQPDNRAMLNAIEARDARRAAELEREREKAASRPKYETPYDRMNRQNRGEMTDAERTEAAARDARISQIPTGGEPTVTGGERARGSDFERNILNTLAALPGAGAAKATTLGRQSLAGLAALLGMDKSDSPAVEKAMERSLPPTESQQEPKMQEQTHRRVSGDTGVRPPAADLKALAEQQQRQQQRMQTRPPMAAPPAQPAQPAAPVAPPQAVVPPQESEADKINKAVMRRDPEAERIAAEKRRLEAIGALDTSVYDKQMAELEKRKAQLEGPQDSFGRLMEYLGEVAATPRGLSSFEAGARGASGVRKLEQARQLEQYNLTKQALDVSQKKLDTVRAFATEQYNVGENRFNQVFKEQFEAAKQESSNEQEALKLAQENTLKRLELEYKADEARERNKTQLAGYSMQQLGERNEQARIDKITSLKQQSRRATDPKIAKELMDQAEDLEKAIGRGAGASGAAGAERNDIAAIKNIQAGLLKELSENLRMDATTRAQKQAQLDQTYIDLARLGGASPTTSTQTGKVPPPPPGFKLN